MWQKCPICNGEGKISNTGTSSSTFQTCPTCTGHRIISEVNGLPPAYTPQYPPDLPIITNIDLNLPLPPQSRGGDVTYG